MRNIKLLIEYEGTKYHGWQSQINALAIQDVIRNALKKLTDEDVNLTGSSRTDVGVHAFGQVANFLTESSIPADKFSHALNAVLPGDIVIKGSEEVDKDFHSRYNSKGKKYRYLIHNSIYPSALLRNRAFHVKYDLDADLMDKASKYFIGEHDFSAFKSTGSSVKSSERTITEATVSKSEDIIEFEIAGNGFLYNMVRIITGTLIDVGVGKIAPDDITAIIDSKDRKQAGKTAPAHGLYLVEVYY